MQGVYLVLALLMGGGLIFFGVGAGNGFGGLLNAFTGGGGGGGQKQVVNQQEKQALRATQANPSDPQGWASLLQARWTAAGQGANYNSSAGTFTTSGKKELSATAQAWQKYLSLTKNPNSDIAILAARAYSALGDYANQAAAWEIETAASPKEPKGFECLAASAYAAKQTRKGDLALAKAMTLVPKLSRSTLKNEISAAKTTPSVAQGC